MAKRKVPEEYRRKLPHIQPGNAVFFVTFNLKGSLPAHIVDILNEEYIDSKNSLLNNSKEKNDAYNNYKDQIDDLLDYGKYGNHWLKDPAAAEIVCNSLYFLDGKEMKLICYSVMSNHVHFVAYKLKKPLQKIMHSLKSYTSKECNKKLHRKGSFWQREYFDRLVRDRNDLDKKIKYTINNPVKAGLVDHWKEHPYTYCRPEFLDTNF